MRSDSSPGSGRCASDQSLAATHEPETQVAVVSEIETGHDVIGVVVEDGLSARPENVSAGRVEHLRDDNAQAKKSRFGQEDGRTHMWM